MSQVYLSDNQNSVTWCDMNGLYDLYARKINPVKPREAVQLLLSFLIILLSIAYGVWVIEERVSDCDRFRFEYFSFSCHEEIPSIPTLLVLIGIGAGLWKIMSLRVSLILPEFRRIAFISLVLAMIYPINILYRYISWRDECISIEMSRGYSEELVSILCSESINERLYLPIRLNILIISIIVLLISISFYRSKKDNIGS